MNLFVLGIILFLKLKANPYSQTPKPSNWAVFFYNKLTPKAAYYDMVLNINLIIPRSHQLRTALSTQYLTFPMKKLLLGSPKD